MISLKRFVATCFGLAVWFCWIMGAFAQPRPATPGEGSGRPADVVVTKDFQWPTVEWVERRYKIEAMSFKAIDETGFDWLGSDEVMVKTADAKGWTVSDEIGDVDSGETHKFDPAKSCIIAVRPGIVVLGKSSVCDDVGEPAPLWFEVEFWEKDPIGYPVGFNNCVRGEHGGPHCADDGNGDDFIGHRRVEFSQQDFDTVLHKVGDEWIETVRLDPCPGQLCAGDFPDYSFTYRITRLPDVRVGLHSVLAEAMQRSGARSELEAIVAGLRSLRAPTPRKVEPETGNLPSKR